MKVLKGTEEIGKYKSIPVNVDWDYLTQEIGMRKEEAQFENALGRFTFFLSVVSLVVLSVIQFLNSILLPIEVLHVDTGLDVVVWCIVFILLYSFFLMRNRDIYLDSLRVKKLIVLSKKISEGKEVKSIEVTSYFDNDVLNIIDDILGEYDERFLLELVDELVKYPLVKRALFRMGLTPQKFVAIAKKFDLSNDVTVDKWIKPLLYDSFQIALNSKFDFVGEVSIFLFLCKFPLKDVLLESNVTPKEVGAIELWASNAILKKRYIRQYMAKAGLKPTSTVNKAFTSAFSPTLVKFSRDLTAEVARGSFNLTIARDRELDELIEKIETGDSSRTLLLGDPGVGKSTILKSLAVRMVAEDVPKTLKDMRLVSFEFNKAFALSPNMDQFESIVQQVLEETAKTKNIILVFDDLNDLVNIRKETASEVVNLMTRAFENYQLRIVATSTYEGYTRHIEPYKSLASAFNTVLLKEPSDEITVQILMDALPKLEKKYGIKVSFESLQKIVEYAHKFSHDRVFPDKPIRILEEAIVKAQNKQLNFVSEELIEELISQKVGVRCGAIKEKEAETLMHMEDELHKRLIGQSEAVDAVSAALRRSRAGLTSDKRPIASFLFFGPTGVGKTELAKAVAAQYYGDEKHMIRVDMSEYQEEQNLQRLIGHETEGEFKGGYLTEAVRKKPFSLVVLDEIEKANPKVLDLFLQILDEGSVTDGVGRKVDFTNTIIIATSNAASREIADLISKGMKYKEVYASIMPKLRQFLRVEFLNRFDRVIMFKPLLPIEVGQIAGLLMNKKRDKLKEKGMKLRFTKELLYDLAKEGYSPMYGARELHRVIQDKVENRIAELIISGKVKSGGEIIIKNLQDFSVK